MPLPPDVELQVSIDDSGSVPRTYLEMSLRALSAAVRDWPRPLPSSGGSPAQPGLRVGLRAVSRSPYRPAGALVAGEIRGIPAVREPPTKLGPEFSRLVSLHSKERMAAASAVAAAHAEADRLADTILDVDPPQGRCSQIWGSISAAAESFSGAGPNKLLLVSDLLQRCEAQVAESFRGVQILVAHLCGDPEACRIQERQWRQRLAARGADSITFERRLERLDETLRAFLRKG